MSKINKILKGEPSSAKIKPLNNKDASQIPKLLTLSAKNVGANNNNNNNIKIDSKIWEVTATNFEEDYVSNVLLGKLGSGAAAVQIGDNVFPAYNNNGIPIDISTPEEMDIALSEDNIGRAYRYIGETTPEYTNGDIYIVREYQ